MFIHGKTRKPYYSIREKIKYYNKRAYNDETITFEQKAYALKRLGELKALNKLPYNEPRFVVVDDKGDIVHGDKLIGALAVYLQDTQRLSQPKIVATLMSNLALEEYLKTKGIELLRCDVGDKYVSDLMKKENLNFGGEQSGHIIFSDFAKTGDGLVSALQVMGLLKSSNMKSSKVLNPFSLHPQKLLNINVSQKIPLDSIDGYAKWLEDIEKSGMRHLVRYSGTENKLRILLEGKDSKMLDSILKDFSAFLKSHLL